MINGYSVGIAWRIGTILSKFIKEFLLDVNGLISTNYFSKYLLSKY